LRKVEVLTVSGELSYGWLGVAVAYLLISASEGRENPSFRYGRVRNSLEGFSIKREDGRIIRSG
jgi:hypothetical protein